MLGHTTTVSKMLPWDRLEPTTTDVTTIVHLPNVISTEARFLPYNTYTFCNIFLEL